MINKIVQFIFVWLLLSIVSSVTFFICGGFVYHGVSGTFELPILIGLGAAISYMMDNR